MSRLTRDRIAEPVSRDQILRRERGQGNIHSPSSVDHEQDWQLYPVDPYSAKICNDHTHTISDFHCIICRGFDLIPSAIVMFQTRSGNGLTALPPTVAALANLRTLRLSNNILTELPRELGSLPRLQEVHVDGNIRLDPQNLDELLQRRPELRIVGSD